jgi:hypothetical protein
MALTKGFRRMTDKLNLRQIVTFTRLISSRVVADPIGLASADYSGCNAVCGCNDKPSCCEQKCDCDQKSLGANSIDDAIWTDPKYRAILDAFDPSAVKTITDFLNLTNQVQSKLRS